MRTRLQWQIYTSGWEISANAREIVGMGHGKLLWVCGLLCGTLQTPKDWSADLRVDCPRSLEHSDERELPLGRARVVIRVGASRVGFCYG